MWRPPALLLCIVPLLVACSGTSTPARTDAGTTGDGAPSGDYPPGPYGTNVGNVVEDASFTGRRTGIDSARETVTLASFHALRSTGKKFLVLNVAAFWCSPCKEEAKEFQAVIVPKYAPKGVAFLSVVLETSSRQPAQDSDVDLWISTYKLTFPVVNDLDGYVTGFFDKNSMPLNMVINLETMKVEKKIIGADLARLQMDLDQLVGG